MKHGWHILFSFDGKLNRQELNRAIARETCDDTPWYEDDEGFDESVKEGWITFTNGKTTVWADGMYE